LLLSGGIAWICDKGGPRPEGCWRRAADAETGTACGRIRSACDWSGQRQDATMLPITIEGSPFLSGNLRGNWRYRLGSTIGPRRVQAVKPDIT